MSNIELPDPTSTFKKWAAWMIAVFLLETLTLVTAVVNDHYTVAQMAKWWGTAEPQHAQMWYSFLLEHPNVRGSAQLDQQQEPIKETN